MSYNKRTWATGNVVGAVDLNRIENGIADIDVDEIRGWGVQTTQLFSESVTTEDTGEGFSAGALTYSTLISAPVIKVTFDGTQYECAYEDSHYGAPWSDQAGTFDFSVYPFGIDSYSSPLGINNEVVTETDGTHTFSISVESLEVSDAFKTAVNNVAPLPMLCVSGVTTYDEMIAAKNAKRLLYFWTENEGYGCYIIRTVDYPCALNPPTTSVIANFDNNNVLVITEQ